MTAPTKYDSIVFGSYPPCLLINARVTKLPNLGETSYGTYPNLESDWQGIKAPLCAICLTISPAEALFVGCFWFISAVVVPPLSLHSTDGSSHSQLKTVRIGTYLTSFLQKLSRFSWLST